jgi:hypothetical protein
MNPEFMRESTAIHHPPFRIIGTSGDRFLTDPASIRSASPCSFLSVRPFPAPAIENWL